MKKCNVCQSVVDEHNECPICGNTLTYEPPCMEDRERFVFNKYYYIYLIKCTWFSILCTVASAVICIIMKPTAPAFLVPAVFSLILSLITAFFKRKLYPHLIYKYNEQYAKGFIDYIKYFLGVTSVILFILAGVIS